MNYPFDLPFLLLFLVAIIVFILFSLFIYIIFKLRTKKKYKRRLKTRSWQEPTLGGHGLIYNEKRENELKFYYSLNDLKRRIELEGKRSFEIFVPDADNIETHTWQKGQVIFHKNLLKAFKNYEREVRTLYAISGTIYVYFEDHGTKFKPPFFEFDLKLCETGRYLFDFFPTKVGDGKIIVRIYHSQLDRDIGFANFDFTAKENIWLIYKLIFYEMDKQEKVNTELFNETDSKYLHSFLLIKINSNILEQSLHEIIENLIKRFGLGYDDLFIKDKNDSIYTISIMTNKFKQIKTNLFNLLRLRFKDFNGEAE